MATKPGTPNLDSSFDDLLDQVLYDTDPTSTVEDIESVEEEPVIIIDLAEDEIDPRLKLISHSSRTLLHKCPRKFQLYRMSSKQLFLEQEKEVLQQLTFDFGTAVGTGHQSVLEGKSESQIYLDMMLDWEGDLLATNPRQNKSFWLAVFAIQKFIALRESGFLSDYDLVYYNGKPAVELSFKIKLSDGFQYRGFVDIILQHKVTKEVMVLEDKTTAWPVQEANYKNSGQAVGYSVVLDIMFPELSSYTVLYLVYQSNKCEYTELPFTKSLLQRALWLQELHIDYEHILMYEKYGIYPMHGESCNDFNRNCEYLSLCTLPTEHLTKPLTDKVLNEIAKKEADEKYDFVVDFYGLIESQIAKGEE